MKDAAKIMKGTRILLEKEEYKQQIEKEKTYLEDCNKRHKRSYRFLLDQRDEQNTWDIIRRYAPKQYFQVINKAFNMKTPGNIMVKFKSKIENEQIIEADKLADYIQKLYKDPEEHDIQEIEVYTGDDGTTIGIEELEWARDRLA